MLKDWIKQGFFPVNGPCCAVAGGLVRQGVQISRRAAVALKEDRINESLEEKSITFPSKDHR